MSGLDVEALLDSTAAAADTPDSKGHPKENADRDNDRKDRRHRDGSRDRDSQRRRRDRSRDRRDGTKDADGDELMKSPGGGSAHGSSRSKRRSRSRDRHHRRRSSIDRDDRRDSGGDYYRGGGQPRTRSRSPDGDRYYRPNGRGGRRGDDEHVRGDRSPRRDRNGRRRTPSPRPKKKERESTPQPTEDERDRRTVFVQQLAARLRTKELIQFFEKVGPVKEAQIVKDRVSGRSKGYVQHICSLRRLLNSAVSVMSSSKMRNQYNWLSSLQARNF
jgi:RNA-binding protein 39